MRTILDQTILPCEVLVIDDASDPPCPGDGPVLDHPRVRVLRADPRGGVSAARNRGIAAARGSWVAFCDDDDLWVPDKLERQLRAARKEGARWCVCDAAIVETGWRLVEVRRCTAQVLRAELHSRNPVPGGGSGTIVERALLREVGGFDPDFSMFADWDLWLRLHRRAEVASSGTIGVLYRLHGGQMSGDAGLAADELARLLEHHADGFGGARHLPEVDRWVLGEMRRAGRHREALRWAARLDEGRMADRLATLVQPAKRLVRPWLLPLVDRVRTALGRGNGDREGRSAVARLRERLGGPGCS